MANATGSKEERKMVVDVIERFGGLDREQVESELSRVRAHLQASYKGNLQTVPTRTERAPHMTDRYYAELLAWSFLAKIGQHGFSVDNVLDALALEG